jgi:uncharacterized protein
LSGSTIEIVKVSPVGKPPVRYTGELLDSPAGWIAARASWVHGEMDLGYMAFMPGDYLDEFFALERPYNAMALYRSTHELVAWYCNVTYPTRVENDVIFWHDLFVDVIVYPDGRTLVLDEDELEQAGLLESDPELHAMILSGRDDLLDLAVRKAYPFTEAR